MTGANDVLIFLHIPKTAGSTFHMILNTRYQKELTYNVFGSRYSDPEIDNFIKRPAEEKNGIRLLKGHMPYGLHNHLPNPARYISILRDPVKRVTSQYYYVKKNTYNPLHDQVEKGNMSISDFVSSGISIGMNNGQCRFLNGDINQYEFNDCNDALYENVLDNIEKQFLWIGLTERFDESILLLSKLLGWKKPPYYIRENVSKLAQKKPSLTSEEVETIEKFNALDMKLYEFANNLLDQEIQKIDGFKQDLETYRSKNRQIQNRWSWLPDSLKKYVI